MVNPYGQRLVTKALKRMEAFELFEERIRSGAEIYSSTTLASRTLSDQAIAAQLLGPLASNQPSRLKFTDGEMMREALEMCKR
jgi:hypothetical protein